MVQNGLFFPFSCWTARWRSAVIEILGVLENSLNFISNVFLRVLYIGGWGKTDYPCLLSVKTSMPSCRAGVLEKASNSTSIVFFAGEGIFLTDKGGVKWIIIVHHSQATEMGSNDPRNPRKVLQSYFGSFYNNYRTKKGEVKRTIPDFSRDSKMAASGTRSLWSP